MKNFTIMDLEATKEMSNFITAISPFKKINTKEELVDLIINNKETFDVETSDIFFDTLISENINISCMESLRRDNDNLLSLNPEDDKEIIKLLLVNMVNVYDAYFDTFVVDINTKEAFRAYIGVVDGKDDLHVNVDNIIPDVTMLISLVDLEKKGNLKIGYSLKSEEQLSKINNDVLLNLLFKYIGINRRFKIGEIDAQSALDETVTLIENTDKALDYYNM